MARRYPGAPSVRGVLGCDERPSFLAWVTQLARMEPEATEDSRAPGTFCPLHLKLPCDTLVLQVVLSVCLGLGRGESGTKPGSGEVMEVLTQP